MRFDEASPFYLVFSGTSGNNDNDEESDYDDDDTPPVDIIPDDIDEQIRSKFFDHRGRFQFRWFKDFLLREVSACVVIVMMANENMWGLKQKTKNADLWTDSTNCEECKYKRYTL